MKYITRSLEKVVMEVTQEYPVVRARWEKPLCSKN